MFPYGIISLQVHSIFPNGKFQVGASLRAATRERSRLGFAWQRHLDGFRYKNGTEVDGPLENIRQAEGEVSMPSLLSSVTLRLLPRVAAMCK